MLVSPLSPACRSGLFVAALLLLSLSACGSATSGADGAVDAVPDAAEPARLLDAASSADGGGLLITAPDATLPGDARVTPPSTPGDAGVLSQRAACRRLVAEYCKRRYECGVTDPMYSSGCFGVLDSCPDYVFGPGSNVTIADATRCADAYATQDCKDNLAGRPLLCGTPRGTRADGESCMFAVQCQSGRCTGDTKKCGVCVTPAAPGASCSNAVCPTYQFCNTDSVCVPRSESPAFAPTQFYVLGGVCENKSRSSGYGGCPLGSACFEEPGKTELRCRPLPISGDRCYEAYARSCWGGGDCDALGTFLCLDVYPCTPALEKSCNAGEVCVCGDTACTRSSCTGPRPEGASCKLPVARCEDGLECVAGRCQVANVKGQFETLCKP